MFKVFSIVVIITNLISNYHCIGITNYVKYKNGYVINIASEDINIFQQKLDNRLSNVKNEFNMIITKVLLNTITPYFIYIIYKIFVKRELHLKFHLIIILFIIFCDSVYILYKWNDYKYGIISAESAIINFNLAMEINTNLEVDKSNINERKIKKKYIGDEIEKYGINAIFCEIPGTLPSNNANPESYAYSFGGFCYIYDSQRRFLDPKASNYVGDKKSQKYRKLQLNKSFDLF